MKTYTIGFKYGGRQDVILMKGRYGTGELAVVAEYVNDPGHETLSINLEAYGLHVNEVDTQFYCKDYSEHEGLPQALVSAGVARMVNPTPVHFGYGSAYLMELTEPDEAGML